MVCANKRNVAICGGGEDDVFPPPPFPPERAGRDPHHFLRRRLIRAEEKIQLKGGRRVIRFAAASHLSKVKPIAFRFSRVIARSILFFFLRENDPSNQLRNLFEIERNGYLVKECGSLINSSDLDAIDFDCTPEKVRQELGFILFFWHPELENVVVVVSSVVCVFLASGRDNISWDL